MVLALISREINISYPSGEPKRGFIVSQHFKFSLFHYIFLVVKMSVENTFGERWKPTSFISSQP